MLHMRTMKYFRHRVTGAPWNLDIRMCTMTCVCFPTCAVTCAPNKNYAITNLACALFIAAPNSHVHQVHMCTMKCCGHRFTCEVHMCTMKCFRHRVTGAPWNVEIPMCTMTCVWLPICAVKCAPRKNYAITNLACVLFIAAPNSQVHQVHMCTMNCCGRRFTCACLEELCISNFIALTDSHLHHDMCLTSCLRNHMCTMTSLCRNEPYITTVHRRSAFARAAGAHVHNEMFLTQIHMCTMKPAHEMHATQLGKCTMKAICLNGLYILMFIALPD